jgi:hypothetical protein
MPAGTSFNSNEPSGPVIALASELSSVSGVQRSQLGPSGSGASFVPGAMFGMKTCALMNADPLYNAPVVPPFAHICTCPHKGHGVPHKRSMRAPQTCIAGQKPQSSWPPQPSPIEPQYCAVPAVHSNGLQSGEFIGTPHKFAMPRPPHV